MCSPTTELCILGRLKEDRNFTYNPRCPYVCSKSATGAFPGKRRPIRSAFTYKYCLSHWLSYSRLCQCSTQQSKTLSHCNSDSFKSLTFKRWFESTDSKDPSFEPKKTK
jgi:hypothetical protein